MYKIILFYKFTPLNDPEAIRLWQYNICQQLNLKGRILISSHGINGTVGGKIEDLRAYVKATKCYSPFKRIVFKWSPGQSESFPRLNVKVRSEIVSFGVPDEIKLDENGIVGGGKRLRPQQLDELISERGNEVVLFDARNSFEAAVGKFKNAFVPSIDHTRDFVNMIDSGTYDNLKDKPVVTYCTGGIRCEVLSMLMINRGFKEVYQLDGGIVAYGDKYADQSLWEGSLYVFDNRKDIKFSSSGKDIGNCLHCALTTSNYENCMTLSCNRLMLKCRSCNEIKYCPSCLAELIYNDDKFTRKLEKNSSQQSLSPHKDPSS